MELYTNYRPLVRRILEARSGQLAYDQAARNPRDMHPDLVTFYTDLQELADEALGEEGRRRRDRRIEMEKWAKQEAESRAT